MSEPDSHDKAASELEVERTAKKPYRKPEFRFERVFETRALTCGKVQQTQSSCAHNRKNS